MHYPHSHEVFSEVKFGVFLRYKLLTLLRRVRWLRLTWCIIILQLKVNVVFWCIHVFLCFLLFVRQ